MNRQLPGHQPPGHQPPVLPEGGGLLLVDKPAGVTSHDVVGRARAVLRTRKIGHAGTLDPMATGLLVLAVERSTKLLGRLALTTKTYHGTIRLGRSTTTDDAEGESVELTDASGLTVTDVRSAIAALTGSISQVPSSVSAIKVDGRRAYDLVRSGESVELAARPVTVSRFEIVGAPREIGQFLDLDVAVDCSTGTYIRALARDLGAALGIGGHLTSLRRTRVGPFSLDDAVDVFGDRAITTEWADGVAARILPAAAAAHLVFPVRSASEDEAIELRHGRSLDAAGIEGEYAVVDAAGDRLLALVVERDGRARPVAVWSAAG